MSFHIDVHPSLPRQVFFNPSNTLRMEIGEPNSIIVSMRAQSGDTHIWRTRSRSAVGMFLLMAAQGQGRWDISFIDLTRQPKAACLPQVVFAATCSDVKALTFVFGPDLRTERQAKMILDAYPDIYSVQLDKRVVVNVDHPVASELRRLDSEQ